MTKHARTRRRGVALLYIAVIMVALMGFCSLAVDYGRVQLAKTELRIAADAAARAAVASLPNGTSIASNNSVAIAAANSADGRPVVLIPGTDIEFGTWDSTTKTFTKLSGMAQNNANSIRVTAQRTAARGTAVPLLFAQALGFNTCDVRAVSVAYGIGGSGGFIGLSSITGIAAKNNCFVASYNSSVTTTPNSSNCNSNGGLTSNGPITGKNNNQVKGSVTVGPAGSVSGFDITGSTTSNATAIATPTLPTWSPGVNPGGVPQNFTVNSNRTLQGGTYWFTTLTINADLTFSGPATVYVNGDVVLNASLAGSGNIPGNLMIYQYGANTFGDDGGNHISLCANVLAPGVDFTAKNNCTMMGLSVFNSLNFKNSAEVYYDEALSSFYNQYMGKTSPTNSGAIRTVQ